jgi:hypothetical protein
MTARAEMCPPIDCPHSTTRVRFGHCACRSATAAAVSSAPVNTLYTLLAPRKSIATATAPAADSEVSVLPIRDALPPYPWATMTSVSPATVGHAYSPSAVCDPTATLYAVAVLEPAPEHVTAVGAAWVAGADRATEASRRTTAATRMVARTFGANKKVARNRLAETGPS